IPPIQIGSAAIENKGSSHPPLRLERTPQCVAPIELLHVDPEMRGIQLIATVVRHDGKVGLVDGRLDERLSKRVDGNLERGAGRDGVRVRPQGLDEEVTGNRASTMVDHVLEQRACLARSPSIDQNTVDVELEWS